MNAVAAGSVVVGLDGSDTGRAAVEYAADLASRRHLPLRLVHASELIQTTVRPSYGWTPDAESVVRNSAQRLLDEAVEVLGIAYPDVQVTAVLQKGSPVRLLLEESHHAHTIVLGSRGTGGFADLLIGSTTLHVAAHATCPVIAVPSLADADNPRHGVVVGVDGSDLSEAAIGYAFETASEAGEKVTAIHVWHDPTHTGFARMMPGTFNPDEVAKGDWAVLAESLSGWLLKFPDVEVEQKVVLGHPVAALVSHAAKRPDPGGRLPRSWSPEQSGPRFRQPRGLAPRHSSGRRRAPYALIRPARRRDGMTATKRRAGADNPPPSPVPAAHIDGRTVLPIMLGNQPLGIYVTSMSAGMPSHRNIDLSFSRAQQQQRLWQRRSWWFAPVCDISLLVGVIDAIKDLSVIG